MAIGLLYYNWEVRRGVGRWNNVAENMQLNKKSLEEADYRVVFHIRDTMLLRIKLEI